MDDDERKRRFESELRSLFPRWRECADLGHGRVPGLITKHGGVGAAKHLLRGTGLSNGFVRLRDHGCLALTVEYLSLRLEFGSLFTHEERAIARRKLTENGMRRGDLPLEPYA
jgi:hypothetical protein